MRRASLHSAFLASSLAIVTAVASGQGAAPPRLSIGTFRGVSAPLYRGWPIILTVDIRHPLGRSAQAGSEVILASADERWTTALVPTVSNAQGAAQAWPFHPASTKAEATFVLTATSQGRAAWWMASEDTARLQPGVYRLKVTLDTTKAKGGGWKGVVSDEVRIRVAPPPAAPTAADLETRALLDAAVAEVQEKHADALAALDAYLEREPKAIGVLTMKGDILAAMSKPAEALACYDRAIAAVSNDAMEPPTSLLRRRRDLMMQLADPKGP